MKDDLAKDSRKENYNTITNHEAAKTKATSERNVAPKHAISGEDNAITSVENSSHIVPNVESMDINMLSLTKRFSI